MDTIKELFLFFFLIRVRTDLYTNTNVMTKLIVDACDHCRPRGAS